MPKITFITAKDGEFVVETPTGSSVMEAAMENDVPGIDADCGGCCSCATCHVYVAEDWYPKTGAVEDMESDMLAVNDDTKPTSRLSCQIEVTDELDGLVVHVPEFQW